MRNSSLRAAAGWHGQPGATSRQRARTVTKTNNPARVFRAPSIISVGSRHTPVAVAVGFALAVGIPTAHAAAPAPGAALGNEFQVNTLTASDQISPAVAADAAGDFVVAWADSSGADGDSFGIFAQRYHTDGTLNGAEFQVNTHTAGIQGSPAVAVDAAGDFVVTWVDSSGADGDGFGIFAQRYRADGTPNGAEFPVNTHTADNQNSPVVAMDAAGDFVVAWSDSSGTDGSYAGVFAQRYHADGTPNGTEFQVNTHTTGGQGSPAAAMDAAGDFVVVWTDYSGADGRGVFAQRYHADGMPNGTEFRINTHTAGDQTSPAVAADMAGDFVVVWTDSGADGGGIFAQRYHADGTPHGEFQVNTHTTGGQGSSAVAVDAAGGFVVTWVDSSGADGDGSGVFAQRYHADGAPNGTEFQVNTHTTGGQGSPAVAMDAAGDFVAAWTWSGKYLDADGDGSGVFAQRYGRESSLDLKATLAAAPADGVQPGGEVALTAGISNTEPVATLTGNAVIDTALNTATGLTATLTFPDGVTFGKATGTNWTCPAAPVDHKLTCTYAAALAAASASENLVVSVTAPDIDGTKLAFSNAVFGGQPDANSDNDTAKAGVAVATPVDDTPPDDNNTGDSGGGNPTPPPSSSGGGGGSFGWLGLGLLGLIEWRRRKTV